MLRLADLMWAGNVACRWSEVVQQRTRIDPKDGGGYGPGYVWQQTPTEINISFEVSAGSKQSAQPHAGIMH